MNIGRIYLFEVDSILRKVNFKILSYENLSKEEFQSKVSYLRKKKNVQVRGTIFKTLKGNKLHVQ